MAEWRYLFFNLNGDGSETLLNGNVKVSGPSLTRVLSGPHQISATINTVDSALQDVQGNLMIRRKKTTMMAEDPNGNIWVGGLVFDYHIDGPVLTIDVAGMTAYAKDMPYDGEYEGIDVDPIDVFRICWGHLQNKPGGNLGLEIDSTASPVRMGKPAEDVAFQTSAGESVNFTAGPVQLNSWSTNDLGGRMDDLASGTPFDYLEEHYWEGDNVRHFLRIGTPSIGSRKDDLRFVLGENVGKMPSEAYDADDVVTEVWVYGAGEGRDRILGIAAAYPQDSLRSVKIIDDKKITSVEEAQARAAQELFLYAPDAPGAGITELVVTNHPNAPRGSYDVGDEVRYGGDHDWGEVDVWVTILKLTAQPESGDFLVASVIRSDRIR